MKDKSSKMKFEYGSAICYSGFRDGQSPETGIFPTYDEIFEDLKILSNQWKYLRLYDCDPHSETVLEVIRKEHLDFKIMLGAYIIAEENNEECPWFTKPFSDNELKKNKEINRARILKLIRLANEYHEIVFSVSVGNEATVSWTDHLVPLNSVIEYVKLVRKGTDIPVTFCENYLPWLSKLKPLVNELDFISIHTYPVWEYKHIDDALEYTKQNYYGVADAYPHKTVVITEAGWATKSNGRGIMPEHVNEDIQKRYLDELMHWTEKEKIMTFVFEAFDESWKGSDEAHEPEKHWGLYKTNREPKLVAK